MLLGSCKQAASYSTCHKTVQPGHWQQGSRTSCSLYGRNRFQTRLSFRCPAVYRNFKDCPVTLEYIIDTVQESVTQVLLFYRTVSVCGLGLASSVLFQAPVTLKSPGSRGAASRCAGCASVSQTVLRPAPALCAWSG